LEANDKGNVQRVARFMQSRFGELKVSEARYEDMLSEANEYYPKHLDHLRELCIIRSLD